MDIACATVIDIALEVEALVNLAITVVVSLIAALDSVDDTGIFAAVSALPVKVDEAELTATEYAVPSDAGGEARRECATAPAGPAILKVTLEREALIGVSIAVIVLRVTALDAIEIACILTASFAISVEIDPTIEATCEAAETGIAARQGTWKSAASTTSATMVQA